MNRNFTLSRDTVSLLIIDVQDKLFPQVERACEVMHQIQTLVRAFQRLNLPIYSTEQYPKGLGGTVGGLKALLGASQTYFPKTTFSCLKDPEIKAKLLDAPITQWVLVGIEAHVCVLQTAKDLMTAGKEVVVINDAIASRSIYDFSTAIAEFRDIGVRVTSTETVIFELLSDAKTPEFKHVIELIK
jgi:nicotinamidase-related amidase